MSEGQISQIVGPQKETVGRIVHYVPEDWSEVNEQKTPQVVAAVITKVWGDGKVALQVFGPSTSQQFVWTEAAVPYSPEYRVGSWSWPERV